MRRPLWLQFLLPAAALLVVAVLINAVFVAWWSSRRSAEQLWTRVEQIGTVIAETNFPRTPVVLDKLKRLTGCDFLITDLRSGQPTRSTLEDSEMDQVASQLSKLPAPETWSEPATVTLHDGPSRVQGLLLRPEIERERLWILLPERELAAERAGAIIPAMLVGGASLLLLVPLMTQVASRIGRRMARLQAKVEAVADGNYDPISDDPFVDDEVQRLVQSVNELAVRLRDLEDRISRSERGRLLGQVAGGLAHDLRNSITGAQLSIQLLQKRNPQLPPKDQMSLTRALKELRLTEHQLRGLLSLGQGPALRRVLCRPSEILRDVFDSLSVMAEHRGVRLELGQHEGELQITADPRAVTMALINLVQNGIEAAGRGGTVLLADEYLYESWTGIVRDSGPGPSAEAAVAFFDPFFSTKQEGTGLGLTVALQVARDHGGRLDWKRLDGWTEFRMALPVAMEQTQEAITE